MMIELFKVTADWYRGRAEVAEAAGDERRTNAFYAAEVCAKATHGAVLAGTPWEDLGGHMDDALAGDLEEEYRDGWVMVKSIWLATI